jgi:hypothetical protein
MRLHRPVLAALALGTLLPVTAASAAAGVAAAGDATSSATLATVSVGALTAGATTLASHAVSVGTLTAGAQNITTGAPSVTFTPLTVDGTATGAVTVTPSTSPKTVGGVSTGALPLNVLSATSPSATLTAAQTSASRTSGLKTSLGSAAILGLPVALNGSLDVGSVTDAAHSQAGKSLTITNVSLPNLADLLAALGIDVTKLPADVLNNLITQLPVTVSAAAQTAIDTANGAVDDAQAAVDAKQTEIANDTTTLNDAAAAFAAQLAAAVGGPYTVDQWNQLDATAQGVVETANAANPAFATTETAYTAAVAALDSAQGQLQPLVDTLNGAIAALGALVDDVLAGTPLVKIGAASVATKAAVGATKAAAVTGYVSGVQVLGQDVLAAITGDSKVDAATLVGTLADDVNSAISSLTGTLSNILAGATGLVVPAPDIALLTRTTSTGTSGAFGTASAVVTALSVTVGSITLPTAYALDGITGTAGIAAIATGFKTQPLSVKVGQLVESAKYRPASSPTGTGGNLPATGVPASLAVVALIGTSLAVGARRRLRTE